MESSFSTISAKQQILVSSVFICRIKKVEMKPFVFTKTSQSSLKIILYYSHTFPFSCESAAFKHTFSLLSWIRWRSVP